MCIQLYMYVNLCVRVFYKLRGGGGGGGGMHKPRRPKSSRGSRPCAAACGVFTCLGGDRPFSNEAMRPSHMPSRSGAFAPTQQFDAARIVENPGLEGG